MSEAIVSSEIVKKACLDMVAYIELSRAQRMADMVRHMSKSRGFLGLKEPMGYQKAFDFLEKNSSDFRWISIWRENSVDDANKVYNLALHSDFVSVSSEHSYILSYFEE